MSHPVPSLRSYLAVFAALLVLTAVTTAVAYVDLGPWSTPAALAIAAAKGLLVALYFMHLRHSSRLTILFATSGVLWLAVLVTLVIADYATRHAVAPWGVGP